MKCIQIVFLFILSTLLFACNNLIFRYEQSSLDGKYGKFGLNEALEFTELNQPVEFAISVEGDPYGMSLSLDGPLQVNTFNSENGQLVVTDPSLHHLKYIPKYGFRGKEEFTVFSRDRSGSSVRGLVTIVVGNPISHLQPSIASRAVGCVSCHLQTSSNLITDFGLHGDGHGKDYTFGGDQWHGGSPYGDHASALATIKFTSAQAAVYVPAARVPAAVAAETGDISFAEYFQMRIKQILPDDLLKPLDLVTLNTKVIEKASVYIGAPTAEQLRVVFSTKAGERAYFSDAGGVKLVTGVSVNSGVFKNSGEVKCDGDLALDGTLYLNALKLETKNGCRLYVTGPVFIYGPIEYLNKTKNSNLQITSAKGIFLGMGSVQNEEGNDSCEPAGGWYYNTFNHEGVSPERSSFRHRVKSLWTMPYTYYRGGKSASQVGDELLEDLAAVERQEGKLFDASCTEAGRNISFERILLNAPQVQSRYTGQFTGSIIAENVLMSLSQFSFSYDSVFSANAVLPMLNSSLYLEIK